MNISKLQNFISEIKPPKKPLPKPPEPIIKPIDYAPKKRTFDWVDIRDNLVDILC
jgi:hypothetical protein